MLALYEQIVICILTHMLTYVNKFVIVSVIWNKVSKFVNDDIEIIIDIAKHTSDSMML